MSAEGAPLDAVCSQGHVVPLLGGPPLTSDEIAATLRRFSAPARPGRARQGYG
jgi:hypothetical protein